jgi:hypothetical protein
MIPTLRHDATGLKTTLLVTVQATVRTLCDLSKFVAKNIILCLHKSVRTVNCYLYYYLSIFSWSLRYVPISHGEHSFFWHVASAPVHH